MKLLVSVTYYRPYVSGLTNTAATIAEGMAKVGHEVRVITIKYNPNLMNRENVLGVEVHRAKPQFKISKGWISGEWFGKIVEGVKWSDTVLVHLPQPEALFIALCCKLLNKKLVVLYHCDIHLSPWLFNKLLEKVIGALHRMVLRQANKIIVSSEDYADNSDVLKKYKDKTEYIFPPIKEWPVYPRGRVEKGVVVGFVGRLAKDKGVEYLLEAIPLIQKMMPGEKLKVVIAGPPDPVGEGRYKEYLNMLVNKYKKWLVILGKLNDREMGSFYKCLNVLVLPSVDSTESLGMVQMEAMLLGVPVVASNLPGVRVPIKETGMGVIVKPKDSVSLADGIAKVLTFKDKYLSKKTKVEKIFQQDKIMELYSSILIS